VRIEWCRQDRAAVLACLKEGHYESIMTSSQGPVDALAHVGLEMGVFSAMREVKVERQREGIPDLLLLNTMVILPFVEASSFAGAASAVLRDGFILLQLGYAPECVREGFNDRYRNTQGGKSGRSIPYHPEVLREEMKRIPPENWAAFRNRHISDLFRLKLVRGTTYAIDGTGLGTDWHLVVLLNVQRERVLLVDWRLLPGNASEKGTLETSVVLDMVREVQAVGGDKAITYLLMDALYADGPLLATLKYGHSIDSLVRVPEDRDIYTDMTQIVAAEKSRWQTHSEVRYISGHKQLRQVSTAAVADLTTWDSYLAKGRELGAQAPTLWGCLIRDRVAGSPEDGQTWALVSTSPFNTAWQGYTSWRGRWLVENTGFRELKEGWQIEKTRWGRCASLVAARVNLTCAAFNVATVARTSAGQDMLSLGIRGLRRQLGEQYGILPVVVYANRCYGVFHIEEIMAALGRPPAESLRSPLIPGGKPPTGPDPSFFHSD
jgi:hypothetical protein